MNIRVLIGDYKLFNNQKFMKETFGATKKTIRKYDSKKDKKYNNIYSFLKKSYVENNNLSVDMGMPVSTVLYVFTDNIADVRKLIIFRNTMNYSSKNKGVPEIELEFYKIGAIGKKSFFELLLKDTKDNSSTELIDERSVGKTGLCINITENECMEELEKKSDYTYEELNSFYETVLALVESINSVFE